MAGKLAPKGKEKRENGRLFPLWQTKPHGYGPQQKSEVFDGVKDKVRKKLLEWNRKSLSRASKEILIKVVAQSIPTYIMSLFRMTLSTYRDLKTYDEQFLVGLEPEEGPRYFLGQVGEIVCTIKYRRLGVQKTATFQYSHVGQTSVATSDKSSFYNYPHNQS